MIKIIISTCSKFYYIYNYAPYSTNFSKIPTLVKPRVDFCFVLFMLKENKSEDILISIPCVSFLYIVLKRKCSGCSSRKQAMTKIHTNLVWQNFEKVGSSTLYEPTYNVFNLQKMCIACKKCVHIKNYVAERSDRNNIAFQVRFSSSKWCKPAYLLWMLRYGQIYSEHL